MDVERDQWMLSVTNALQARWLLSWTNVLEEGGSSEANLVDDQSLEACAALGEGQQVPASAGERAGYHLCSPDHRLAHLPPRSGQLLAALLHLQHHTRCMLPSFDMASQPASGFVGIELIPQHHTQCRFPRF